ATQVPVVAYPIRKGQRATLLNRSDVEKLYDLEAPKKRTVKLGFLINQIIHSYVMHMVESITPKGFHRVLVCSDFERNRQLFELEIEELLVAMQRVGTSYPSSIQYKHEEKTQDYSVTTS